MSEDEPTDKERAEAEALAHALDNEKGAAESAPADALETAALLRHAELSDLAARRVFERLAPALERRRRVVMVRLLAGTAVLVALAVPIVVLTSAPRSVVTHAPRAGALSATALPRPSAQLLTAQARAASDPRKLQNEMRSYRDAVYDALAARYQ